MTTKKPNEEGIDNEGEENENENENQEDYDEDEEDFSFLGMYFYFENFTISITRKFKFLRYYQNLLSKIALSRGHWLRKELFCP